MNTDHRWVDCHSCFCRYRTQSAEIDYTQCPNCNKTFYPRDSYMRDGSLFNGWPFHFKVTCYSCMYRIRDTDYPNWLEGGPYGVNSSIVRSSDNIIGWDYKEIFFRFHCDRYVPPRSRKQSYDGCEELFFVAMRYNSRTPWGGRMRRPTHYSDDHLYEWREERMSPREYFDFISELCRSGSMDKSQEIRYRRLGRRPNVKFLKPTSESWGPTRGDDFQKGDFKKGDFQKGDFK